MGRFARRGAHKDLQLPLLANSDLLCLPRLSTGSDQAQLHLHKGIPTQGSRMVWISDALGS